MKSFLKTSLASFGILALMLAGCSSATDPEVDAGTDDVAPVVDTTSDTPSE